MLRRKDDGTVQLYVTLKQPTPEELAQFRNSYDPEEQKEIKQLKGNDKDQLLFRGKIYIPRQQQKEFVRKFHKDPLHGHQGMFKTTKRLQEKYNFPELRQMVKQVIKDCNIYNKAKAARHKPYGLLQPTEIPDKVWNTIAWNFITGLPTSKDPITGVEYDTVWVIIDRLTKYGYFLPFKGTATAEQLAYAFIRYYLDKHGVPEKIISDRDKLFTSKFGTSFFKQIGAKLRFSTAYHPQTDGQTERLNQTLEQYLRSYVNYQQNNWVELLPLAQIAYNTSVNEDMGISPHTAVYGHDAETQRPEQSIRKAPIITAVAPRAETVVTEIKTAQARLQSELQFLQQRMAQYYNKKRIEGPILARGDKVYLLRQKQNATTNLSQIKTKRPSDKLDFKKLGPFKIEEVISKTNYRLSLPKTMRIHPVFHISLLEPAPKDAPLKKNLEIEKDDNEYEVEKILDSRMVKNKIQYLVK
ncbi:hypothetical protein DL767_010348 [Monosporascus sp. MG133]|nr:hypothetical protein DL767_010348 [Monosporascus sp. MG133]